MTLQYPVGLACLHCGSNKLKPGSYVRTADYYWRYMHCKWACKKHTYWGTPVLNGDPKQIDYTREHMVMVGVPKPDPDNGMKTKNLRNAIPINVSNRKMGMTVYVFDDTVIEFKRAIENSNVSQATAAAHAVAKAMTACIVKLTKKAEDKEDDAAE